MNHYDRFAALDNMIAKHTPQSKGQLVPARQGDTLIAALVDRSGSMSSCLTAMEQGLNGFIADQPGAAITLAQFDEHYELVWPMQAIEGVPHYRLVPRGRTALLDAIGEFITETADTLGNDTEYRPVICVIVTDGAENASREWTKQAVVDLIDYWRENYHWEFVFLGANIDAVKVGESLGVPTNSSMKFDTRHAAASMQILSKHVSQLRASKPAGFTADDRRRALGQ